MKTSITKTKKKLPQLSENTSQLTVWLLLLLLAAIWGTSFILVKKSLVAYSSIQVGSIRIVSAFLFFLPVLIVRRKDFLLKNWKYLAISGFLAVFFPAYIFAVVGKELPSALSGALNSLTPLFTLIIGALFFNRKFQKIQIAGIFLGILGSLFLIFNNLGENISFNSYGFLVFIATIMYGFNLNIVKNNLNEMPAILVTTGLLSVIGPIAAVILFSTDFFEITIKQESHLPLYYAIGLGVFSTGLATILFNRILQISNPVLASSVTYLIPIFAFIWGILDGEVITAQHFTGMAIILIGVYLVNKSN